MTPLRIMGKDRIITVREPQPWSAIAGLLGLVAIVVLCLAGMEWVL